jgi:hypothetical protein
MGRSGILTASLLLPVWASAGDAPSKFRIEFELSNPSGTQVSIPIRCTKGCEWQQTSIDCPQGETVCHATLHAKNHPDSYQEVEIPKPVRPIAGSNCLGVALTSARADSTQGVKGARITNVLASSPAAQAGFQSGDVVTAFNTVPVGQASDLYEAVRATEAGQPFEVTIDRQGSRVNISGIMGVQTTSDTCVRPDAPTLQGPAVTQEGLNPAPFTLIFSLNQLMHVRVKATCFEGCAWDELGLVRSSEPLVGGEPPARISTPVQIDIDENGMGSPYEQSSN